KTTVQSWFLDLNLVMGYWSTASKRSYHHTAPVNALYALHESLLLLKEEGLEQAWARHQYHHQALKAGLEALGLDFVVPVAERLPQLNAVRIPEGVDDGEVRRLLLEDYQLEIGAGLGVMAGKVWRIGLMGYACRKENVFKCLSALDDVLARLHAPVNHGVAIAAARAIYA
ncbi:MAG: aminotransferase class V-fold PLP-dependent enzyme, partial [Mariprofundaceae bacterium]|nr:aminotransferase class V-fold PLP-dependent enzyme [Mariprofundaceae bacterium]